MLRRRVPVEPNITRLLDAASQGGVARGGHSTSSFSLSRADRILKSEVFSLADFLFACGALVEKGRARRYQPKGRNARDRRLFARPILIS